MGALLFTLLGSAISIHVLLFMMLHSSGKDCVECIVCSKNILTLREEIFARW